jgi:predicted component of type VI protein secretion system
MAEPVDVDGSLVQELGEAVLRVQVVRPNASDLEPGDPVALRFLNDDQTRYLGVVLSIVDEEQRIMVLLDRTAMTEQVVHSADGDRVPGVEESLGLDPRYG